MSHDVHDVTDGAREVVVRVRSSAEPIAHDMAEGARDLSVRALTAAEPVAERLVERAGEALDISLIRGGAALLALRGGPVGPPLGRRRWPWALGAALLGAAAGAVVAVVVSRVVPSDAPDAQEPEDVEAVVDLDRPATTAPTAPTTSAAGPPPG